jgi:hypothetical protein
MVYNKPPVGVRSMSQATLKKQVGNNIPLNTNHNDDKLNESIFSNYNQNNNYNYYNNNPYQNTITNSNNGYNYINKGNLNTRNQIMQTNAGVDYDNESENLSIINKSIISKPYVNTMDDDKSIKSGISGLMYYNQPNKFVNYSVYEGNFYDPMNKSGLNESVLNKSDIGKIQKKTLKPNFDKKNEVELMPEYVEVMEKDNKLRNSKSPFINPLQKNTSNFFNSSVVNSNLNSSNLTNCNNQVNQQSNHSNVPNNISQQAIKPSVYVKNNLKPTKNASTTSISTINTDKTRTDKFINTETIQSGITDKSTINSGYSVNTIRNSNNQKLLDKNNNYINTVQNTNYGNMVQNTNTNNNYNDNFYVNIEDLMVLEEKLTYIINVKSFCL